MVFIFSANHLHNSHLFSQYPSARVPFPHEIGNKDILIPCGAHDEIASFFPLVS